jgi:succinate dehydrogenase cytochrome b556 subunit
MFAVNISRMLGAKLIEGFVGVLTIGSGLIALWILVGLLRLRSAELGPVYRGGIGQWSWAAHRITGILVLAFLYGHIVDTFGLGFGPELYDETISLYKQWWFKPFEVALIAATLYHAALKQRQFAVGQLVLFVVGFLPPAFFMLRSAYESSPLG